MLVGTYETELRQDGSLVLPARFLEKSGEPYVYARFPQEEGPVLCLAFTREALPVDEEPADETQTLALPLREGAVTLPHEALEALGGETAALIGVLKWMELWRKDDWDRETDRAGEELALLDGLDGFDGIL